MIVWFFDLIERTAYSQRWWNGLAQSEPAFVPRHTFPNEIVTEACPTCGSVLKIDRDARREAR